MPQLETFYSKYTEHQIVMIHDTKMLVDGNKLFTSPSKIIKFSRGVYQTNDAEIIAFLKAHAAYGIDFFGSEDARAATTIPAKVNPVTGQVEEAPEVAKPVRTRKGEKAAVAKKPTTADDVDAEAEGASSDDE
jgi:hypothetical protein